MENRYMHMEDIQTRDNDTDDPTIEGYFAVFDSVYPVWEGVTESIAPGAFTDSVSGDVRALYNHNTDLILGRTSAGTLELKQDDHGLWGRVKINRKDSSAMDAYERIKRGDITGCSFGFEIEKEKSAVREDGSVHFTIEKVNPLFEVSPCVFPAYEATRISARGHQADEIHKRQMDAWKVTALKRLKGEQNGTESLNAPQKD